MSDHHLSLVDTSISADESEAAAHRVMHYLVEQGIVEETPSDCLLSGEPGHRPGRNFLAATDRALTRTSAINGNYRDFTKLKVNGFAICTHACMAYNPQGEWARLSCPQCRQGTTQDEAWSSAVSEWQEGVGEGLLNCPHCGRASPIRTWDHHGSLALGHLSMTFWNWPPLSLEFIARLSALSGNPLRMVVGRI